jgi:hypothetical protein
MALHANVRLGSYLCCSVNYEEKKFYNIDNKDRCYKTIPWLLPQHANNIKWHKTPSPQLFPRYLNEPQCYETYCSNVALNGSEPLWYFNLIKRPVVNYRG